MCRKAVRALQIASGTGICQRASKKVFRLVNRGCTNRPFYHIVVAEKFREVKDQVVEQVGSYDPMPNERNEKLVALNFERIRFWIGEGAGCSEPVANVLGLAGFFPISPQLYLQAWRNRKNIAEAASQEDKSDAN